MRDEDAWLDPGMLFQGLVVFGKSLFIELCQSIIQLFLHYEINLEGPAL